MITAEDVMKLVREGESNRVEMKRCKDTVPESVWETYPRPTIHEEDEVNEVWLTMPVPSEDTERSKEKGKKNADKNLSAHLSAHLSAQQMQIYEIMSENPELSTPEIAKKLGVKEIVIRSQKRSMSKFVEFVRVGSRKTGKWVVSIKANQKGNE